MLGAGNVTSIPVLDVLYELLAHNRVVILKVNPTQDPLVPVFERALAPLIEPGFLRIVRGGGDVGAYLTDARRHRPRAHHRRRIHVRRDRLGPRRAGAARRAGAGARVARS